ncbi:hypothetical protein [Vulgatibacter sp.]|uniref:hypothetical protein n=1 Tax=Vulgatibacter sp. TaxID=1971226 RepID=UPI00356619AA
MTRFARHFCALLVLAAAGCASGPARTTEQLTLASRDYHDALQYGDFQVIARYLRADARTDYLARAFGMEKSLSVLEFTTIGTEIAPEGESARMVTRLSWYELPSTVVKTENVFIQWKRIGGGVATDGVWTIDSIEGGPLPVEPAAEAAEPTEAALQP